MENEWGGEANGIICFHAINPLELDATLKICRCCWPIICGTAQSLTAIISIQIPAAHDRPRVGRGALGDLVYRCGDGHTVPRLDRSMDTPITDDRTNLSQPQSHSMSIPSIQLGRELGRGGMAVVLEGLDLGFSPPRRVAVKLMSTELSSDMEFRRRFEREASLVATFRHDGIVHVYACGETGGAKYIVMEYLPGGTLAERLVRGALPAAQAIATGIQLASALAYAHEREVIHRDVKPGNVLFTSDHKAVLSDFGVAKVVSASASNLTRHAMVIGSTRYMAPEQERAETVTDRADVYAFGLMLFEMLTGRTPPPAERVLRRVEEGKQIRTGLAFFSANLATLVCRCLLIDPVQRPSALELQNALSGIVSNATVERPSFGRSHMMAVAVVATVCTAGAVVAWSVWHGHRDQAQQISPVSGATSAQSGPPNVSPERASNANATAATISSAPPTTASSSVAASKPPPAAIAPRREKTSPPTETTHASSKPPIQPTPALTADEWMEKAKSTTDPQDKIRAYTEAIRLRPTDAIAYHDRGLLLHKQKDLDGAYRDFSEAIRLKPDYAGSYNDRANILREKGDLEGALREYGEAIRIQPEMALAYLNRGKALADKRDLDAAIRDFSEVIRLKPDLGAAYLARGNVLQVKGDKDAAIRDYSQEIALSPTEAQGYAGRGLLLLQKGNAVAAEGDLNEAIRINPQFTDAYYYRGILFSLNNNAQKAYADFSQVILLNPNFRDVYFNRGNALAQMGDDAEAISDLQKFLDMGGGDENKRQNTQRFIAQLRQRMALHSRPH
jgi:serine/threonine protein kinase/lipoprotein NlpI